jgi:hypothetical protein
VVAVVDSSYRVKPGDVLDLTVPLDKIHLFDPESGLSLHRLVQEAVQSQGAPPVTV